MAKGKNKGGKNKKKKSDGAAEPKAVPQLLQDIEHAFELGDYSGVRRLGAQAASDESLDDKQRERAAEIVEMTVTDPVVWAVGAAATTIALIVGMLTLGG
jgi:hypothetical protein